VREVLAFLWGASALGACAAAVFFARFWRETRDRLFALFALAFLAMAVNWVGLAATAVDDEARTYFYLVRLLAFVLILAAVVDKNRGAER
jgi:hypothetical protein